MQKFIKIESKGIIDPQAFILIGASTKREDDTKIGFFGSGLKYSIAFLLRNKINFKVFAEYKEIKFEVKNTTFREKDFGVIWIDGKETSMTISMGADWTSWGVAREIYCNAIDEGESSITIVKESDCIPQEEKTTFYIEIDENFQEIIDNWDLYFSENRKDLVWSDSKLNQIYTGGESLLVYRKGIRALYVKAQPTIFSYDMQWIKINESRVVKDEWNFKYELKDFLQKIKDKKIIAQILNKVNDCWEKDLYWNYTANQYSDEWCEVIGDKILVPYENAGFWQEFIKKNPELYLVLPGNLIEGLKTRFVDKIKVVGDVDGVKGTGEFMVVEQLTKRESSLLQEAVDFLKIANYEIKYPIKIVEFSKKNRLGQAKDETILLSKKLFEISRKKLVAVIIEEQEHLVTDYSDETRAFQDHLFEKIVSLMEDHTNKYL